MGGLLSCMIVMGYLVGGLFFLKFWKASRDRLFLVFGLAFWLLAVQRALLVLLASYPAANLWLYVLRLIAFSLILIAILDKNRGPGASAG